MASARALDARPGNPGINADLQDVADQLHREFANRLEPGEVDECLKRISVRFEDANVRSFVPLLVRRYARGELQARLANTSPVCALPKNPSLQGDERFDESD